MLESLRALGARVECYDLGLTPREVRAIPRWAGLFYHKFDYAAHPPHLNVEVAAGEYAWKPVIVADVVERIRQSDAPDDVLWSDAGSYFHAVEPLEARIRSGDGLWVRRSSGTMAQWTHPSMFDRLREKAADFADLPNADATLVGFATGHPSRAIRDRVYREVVVPWRTGALDKECIAPRGSSRRNHRQDQALLSYLVHKAGFAFASESRQEIGVRCKCDRWFYQYIGFHVPAPVYAWCCLY